MRRICDDGAAHRWVGAPRFARLHTGGWVHLGLQGRTQVGGQTFVCKAGRQAERKAFRHQRGGGGEGGGGTQDLTGCPV
eukprot:1146854-Pelagomonas_calceolata.AAC.2